jgi:hypothetical protein
MEFGNRGALSIHIARSLVMERANIIRRSEQLLISGELVNG